MRASARVSMECVTQNINQKKEKKRNTYRARVVCGINKANHLLLIRRSNLILQIAATGGREGPDKADAPSA